LCDYRRLSQQLKPGDVLLVEGTARVSEVIKLITQSPWTHAALYIGRLSDIRDRTLREVIIEYYQRDYTSPLIIEALLGQGTRVAPLSKYEGAHLRICRPDTLTPADAQRVIAHVARRLGSDYDVRQLLDLARFFFPWTILPRRWRSSLFQHNAGEPTRTVCSCLLAEAFDRVDYPILPFIECCDDGTYRFHRRNPRLFTPKDFDYSPYFSIIKHPFLALEDMGVYQHLPWSSEPLVYSDRGRRYSTDIASALAMPQLPAAAAATGCALVPLGKRPHADGDTTCPA
jgi:hypothetical protein